MDDKIKVIPRAEIQELSRVRSDIQSFIDSIPRDNSQAIEREFKKPYDAIKFAAAVRHHLKKENIVCILRGNKVYAHRADPEVEIVRKEG